MRLSRRSSAGFDELVHQLRGRGVADAASLFTRGEAHRDEEMRFAGAGVAEQHDGFAGVEVGAGCERRDRRRVHSRRGREVEVGEAFDAREPRFGDASLAASLGAFVDFGGEDLGKEGEVGVLRALRDLRESAGVGTHDREAQLAGRGADRRGGGGVRHLGHWLASNRSS